MYLGDGGGEEHDDGEEVEELAHEDPPQLEHVGEGHHPVREEQQQQDPGHAQLEPALVRQHEAQDPVGRTGGGGRAMGQREGKGSCGDDQALVSLVKGRSLCTMFCE